MPTELLRLFAIRSGNPNPMGFRRLRIAMRLGFLFARCWLDKRAVVSVAAEGFAAPGVGGYPAIPLNPSVHNGKAFGPPKMQIAAACR